MLLPSAFACEGQSRQRPQRPKLASFGAITPTSHPQIQQPTSVTGLIASRRALHAILGGPQSVTSQSSTNSSATLQQSRIQLRASKGKPLQESPITPQRPPRGTHKRRRSTFESDEENISPPPLSSSTSSRASRDAYTTPKRRRLVPLSMPLGLTATDFHSLSSPEPVTPDEGISMPSPPFLDSQTSFSEDDEGVVDLSWTLDDDKALVSTVLEKLKLSKREWNDCARQLGKDKDSLGRRWRALVGDGEIGLRRGAKWKRVDLDIDSW